MTDQSSVFSTEQPPATPAQTPPAQEQQPSQEQAPAPTASSDNLFADQLAAIKNERGEPKYKDPQTALDALKHSQEYIPQLKQQVETLRQENERLKAQQETMASFEDTINRLTSQRQPEETTPAPSGLTPEQVQELLEQQLSQREMVQVRESNLKQVEQAITQMFGEKTREVVGQKAQELGLTVDRLGQLAAESPQAVLALFNAKSRSPQGTQPSSSVNIPPINPPKDELQRPEKSLLSGSTMKDQVDFMRKIKEKVYQEHGITD